MNPTIQISIFAFANLLLNFLSQVLIAAMFGASGPLDAYIASTTIPFLLLTVVSGSLTYALVPQFVSIQSSKDGSREIDFLRTVVMGIGGLFLVVAVLLFLASPAIVRWTTPGFDTQRLSLASTLLRIQAPGMFFSSIAVVLLSFQHSRRRFLLISSAPLLPPFIMILGIYFLGDAIGVTAIAGAALASSILQVIVLLPSAFIRGFSSFRFDSPGFRTLLRQIFPLIGGSVYFKTDALVDRFLLSGLGGGAIASLWYSRKLIDASLALATTGIATSSFPTFSSHATGEKRELFQSDLNYQLSLLAFVVLPLTMLLLAYAEPLIRLLLQRGQFNVEDSDVVSALLIGQLGVFLGGALGVILANAFYALGDTRTPTMIGIFGFTLGIVLKFLMFREWGVLGIAIAASAYTLFNVTVEFFFLRRSIFALELRPFYQNFLRIILIGACSLLPLYGLRRLLPDSPFGMLAGVLVYLAFYWMLVIVFRVEIASRVAHKLKNWRGLL